MRVLVAGGPRTGKTTLAQTLGWPIIHTDSFIYLGWSEASAEVARLIDVPGPWCIEGVAVARALRKWFMFRIGRRVRPDVCIHLSVPLAPLTDGQRRMAKGCETVWRQIADDLHQSMDVVYIEKRLDEALTKHLVEKYGCRTS